MKILYILGCGRSGTTLINLILGNHERVQGTGEIYHLQRKVWSGGGDIRCACGAPADECPFWSRVREVWAASVGQGGAERYMAYQERFEQYKPLYALRLLWTIRERLSPSDAFLDYVRMTVLLYEAVSTVSGKPHVVDSSKNPLRAYALMLGEKHLPGMEFYTLHVVRDGRGVIFSKLNSRLRKAKWGQTVPPLFRYRASAYWIAKNLLCEWLTKLHARRSLRLRYEDLIEHPSPTLDRIENVVGIDLSRLKGALERSEPLQSDHIVDGNRLRMSRGITLRLDTKWQAHLPRRERVAFWRFFGWGARRYGYREEP